MIVSACAVAVLLTSLGPLFDFDLRVASPDLESTERLIVQIRGSESQPKAPVAMDGQAAHSLSRVGESPAAVAEVQHHAASFNQPEPTYDAPAVQDWRAIADASVHSSLNEYFAQEESRTTMWRQTHSIMFVPTGGMVSIEEEPAIPDFRFRPRVYVAGLGMTIGSCFVGIPFVGVPVEQRTVAIRLFVCAGESG